MSDIVSDIFYSNPKVTADMFLGFFVVQALSCLRVCPFIFCHIFPNLINSCVILFY